MSTEDPEPFDPLGHDDRGDDSDEDPDEDDSRGYYTHAPRWDVSEILLLKRSGAGEEAEKLYNDTVWSHGPMFNSGEIARLSRAGLRKEAVDLYNRTVCYQRNEFDHHAIIDLLDAGLHYQANNLFDRLRPFADDNQNTKKLQKRLMYGAA